MATEEVPPLNLESVGLRFSELTHVTNIDGFVEINPKSGEWSITEVSILLNELKDWRYEQKFRLRETNDSKYMSFVFRDAENLSTLRVRVEFSGKVHVAISVKTLYRQWQSCVANKTVNTDNRGRMLKKQQSISIVYF